MKKRTVQGYLAILFFGIFGNLSAGLSPSMGFIPKNIILKNASAFDIIYKPILANEIDYKGVAPTYEENIIPAGTGKMLPTYGNRPIRLAIKRYGIGSSLSSWTDVTDPDILAYQQMNDEQYRQYYFAITRGKMPIINVKSGYTGGWNFVIGYTK